MIGFLIGCVCMLMVIAPVALLSKVELGAYLSIQLATLFFTMVTIRAAHKKRRLRTLLISLTYSAFLHLPYFAMATWTEKDWMIWTAVVVVMWSVTIALSLPQKIESQDEDNAENPESQTPNKDRVFRNGAGMVLFLIGSSFGLIFIGVIIAAVMKASNADGVIAFFKSPVALIIYCVLAAILAFFSFNKSKFWLSRVKAIEEGRQQLPVSKRKKKYSGDKDHVVYMIHVIGETDPKRVYVGVSNNFERRAHQHKTDLMQRKHANKHLSRAHSSGQHLTIKKIKENLTKMEAYDEEYRLRPHWNVSWNIRPGGLPGIHF